MIGPNVRPANFLTSAIFLDRGGVTIAPLCDVLRGVEYSGRRFDP